jgi:hypothetical protein
VPSDQGQDTVPINFSLRAINHVGDISAIEAFSPSYKELGGDQFFRGHDPRFDSKHDCRLRSLNPGRIDRDHAITHSSN